MVAIEWSSEFETGVDAIDDQHRRLVGFINDLHAVPDEPDPGVIEHLLESVIDYTLYHFAFEECLLEDSGYPLLDAHKQVHARFAEDLRSLRQKFRTGELSPRELNDTLAKWLFNHIRNADTAATQTNN